MWPARARPLGATTGRDVVPSRGGRAMKKGSRKTRQLTRREFVGGAVAMAGVLTGAPALLRGRDLNSKMNIAIIPCGGRALASLGELTLPADGRGGNASGGRGRGEGGGPPGVPHPDENVVVLC